MGAEASQGHRVDNANTTENPQMQVKLVATPFGYPVPIVLPNFDMPGDSTTDHLRRDCSTCCCGLGAWRQARAFHTSILVDGRELTFSWNGIEIHSVEGVFEQRLPTHSQLGEQSLVFDMGYTNLDATDLYNKLKVHFRPGEYDLLKKNCNSFSDCALFCATGARLDDRFRTLERLGLVGEKHVGLVSKITRGAYVANPLSEDFNVHEVVAQLEEEMSHELVAQLEEEMSHEQQQERDRHMAKTLLPMPQRAHKSLK